MAFIFEPGALRDLFGDKFNSISTLAVDVTISESHSLSAQVTDKPVEDGSNINDNIILSGARLTIEGVLTDGRFTSQADKWEALKAIRRSREPFIVTTSLDVYDSMVIAEISADRDIKSTGAVFFTADLVQVRIIESMTAQVPIKATPEPRKAKQAPKADKGKQQAKPLDNGGASGAAGGEDRARRSFAKQLFGG